MWRVVCVAPEDLLVLEFGPARAHLRRGRQRRRLRGVDGAEGAGARGRSELGSKPESGLTDCSRTG
eukprot:scaffold6956_cov61-Phaeocystis_antarctica.AAC.4